MCGEIFSPYAFPQALNGLDAFAAQALGLSTPLEAYSRNH
jgi:hypothetical protein